ncbi:MAG TPA: FAD-dependent oxidoreductase, partial [Armatimonadaceae bacterium]|nr:FAD-dependent oxidoreductase [Armatimonadaceae bacterium]
MRERQAAREEMAADVAILGGGTGGVAAALAALRAGKTVILTEATDWVGGQLTSQAVPPDENPWIEERGCTRSYRRLRDDIRDYYRRFYPLSAEARADPHLNPGGGRVSRLCHEPRVALNVMNGYLLPYVSAGRLTLLLEHEPVGATTEGDRVTSVTARDRNTGAEVVLRAPYFLDATELGDVLPLAGVEYVAGAESRDETGEPHAVDGPAQPLNQQAVTWCFALSHHPGEDHTIERPEQYDFWREYRAPFWPDRQLGWAYPHPITLEPRVPVLFPEEVGDSAAFPLWEYRRILSRQNLEPGACPSDVTLVNWP